MLFSNGGIIGNFFDSTFLQLLKMIARGDHLSDCEARIETNESELALVVLQSVQLLPDNSFKAGILGEDRCMVHQMTQSFNIVFFQLFHKLDFEGQGASERGHLFLREGTVIVLLDASNDPDLVPLADKDKVDSRVVLWLVVHPVLGEDAELLQTEDRRGLHKVFIHVLCDLGIRDRLLVTIVELPVSHLTANLTDF